MKSLLRSTQLLPVLLVTSLLLVSSAPMSAADKIKKQETESQIDSDEIRTRVTNHPSTDSTGNPITVTAGPIGTWVPLSVGECWADGHNQQYLIASPFPETIAEVRPIGTGEARLVVWQLITPGGDLGAIHLQNQCDPNDFVPTPPPQPVEVWARTPLPTPSVLTSPRVKGLVGIPNLFWYEGPTIVNVPPITLGDWSVVATGEIESINWYADDELVGTAEGDTVTGSEDNPAAEGLFKFAGDVELSARVVWAGTSTVTYLPTGDTFVSDLGTATRTESRTYTVEERQASVNEGSPND